MKKLKSYGRKERPTLIDMIENLRCIKEKFKCPIHKYPKIENLSCVQT